MGIDWETFAEDVLGRIEALEAEVAALKSAKPASAPRGGGGGGFGGSGRKKGEGAKLAADGRIPFGKKHYGKLVEEVAEVDPGYLKWLMDQHLTGEFELREPLLSNVKSCLGEEY